MRSSSVTHAVAAFLIVAFAVVGIPSSAVACDGCWPTYYEVMSARPSNWVSVGYNAYDAVWMKPVIVNQTVYYTKWYVIPGDDPNWHVQPDECCPSGPWYISPSGSLFLAPGW